ncbi:cytochrome P450 [Parvularcula oceani]|uniref:cytochrome P450 n=1 Tax=Parvularcula oceani TaxID=1247963 RepID=UPI00056D0899|nr:cytochrome P450 [Parvularcula oceani]
MSLPHAPEPDVTLAFLREGYPFVRSRCARLGADGFKARLSLQPVTFVSGRAAAEMFYAPGRFTRRGAMPVTTLTLLQDRGSVQALDGEAHRQRKALWMRLAASEEAVGDLSSRFEKAFARRAERWKTAPPAGLVLHDEARWALTEAACEWVGLPQEGAELEQRKKEFSAMIDGAGSFGGAQLRGQILRQRSERWARGVMAPVLQDPSRAAEGSPLRMLAEHRDADGQPLDETSAVVELLNTLRPAVAVARFVAFAALELHKHPEWKSRLREDEAMIRPFAQEVRRLSPFFPVIAGRVLKPFSWRGEDFAEEDWVILDLYGTNRDPAAWEAPEEFRPERFADWPGDAYAMAPQGAGPYETTHRCPGERATIALMEAALRVLIAQDYVLPEQDLRVKLTRFPALPGSGIVIKPAAG